LIQYKSDSCIRNSYFHNQCSDCVNICSEDVFSIFQNKIVLDSEKCTLCSACLGSCPSEALLVPNIDPNVEVAGKIADVFECDTKTCLARFDSHHLAVASLKNEKFKLDLSKCENCQIGEYESVIQNKVEKTNTFLEKLGVENRVGIKKETEEKSKKRELFKNILKKGEGQTIPQKDSFSKKFYPLKQKLLVDEVKKLDIDLKNGGGLIWTQEISSNCTNCGDCIQFCPTEALLRSSDKLQIFIRANLCISCGVCNHICKVDAIQNSDEVGILDLMKPKELIKFEMATCPECKTPFIKRGDEQICDRCYDFVHNHSNIFTLARDM
jgi:energy-converting hydrogenase A subunit P